VRAAHDMATRAVEMSSAIERVRVRQNKITELLLSLTTVQAGVEDALSKDLSRVSRKALARSDGGGNGGRSPGRVAYTNGRFNPF
jgi:hypothetical protein